LIFMMTLYASFNPEMHRLIIVACWRLALFSPIRQCTSSHIHYHQWTTFNLLEMLIKNLHFWIFFFLRICTSESWWSSTLYGILSMRSISSFWCMPMEIYLT
jgi:hypothetical protein